MNFKLKIEGVEHKSQLIIINSKKMTVICDDDFRARLEYSEFICRYEGTEVFAEYLSKSRIDGYPMFRIDTLQLERDEKISKIIYSK